MESKKHWHSLKPRIISASVLVPMVLSITYIGGIYFTLMVLMGGLLMIWEWQDMVRRAPSNFWYIIGIIYTCGACFSILYIRQIDLYLMLWLCLLVWATDIGAYFTGLSIGGAKIWPAVSPKKTWAGLIGGILASIATCGIFGIFVPEHAESKWIMGGMLLALLSQVGDFFESGVKRKFGVKDSSNLIPGHGGILDRVDGLVAAAMSLTLWMLIH